MIQPQTHQSENKPPMVKRIAKPAPKPADIPQATAKDDKTEAIRLRLQEIRERNNGELTPELVVEDAKQKDSPLHSQFEWDIKKAAYSRWIDQARTLIRRITYAVTIKETTYSLPVYVRNPEAVSSQQSYIPVPRNESEGTRAFLAQEIGRVLSNAYRARAYAVNTSHAAEAKALEAVIELLKPFANGAGDEE